MTLPKHQNPKDEQNTATAPYNFVPLPEKIIPAKTPLPGHDYYDLDYHTGHISCKLTSASPLYIRCGVSPADFNKKDKDQSPEFFTDPITGHPVIPGSSLRGMLRAMIEIVSYGKVQPVSNNRLIYRVIGDTTSFGNAYRDRLMREDAPREYTPLLKAGYMEKRGLDWAIRPAQDIDGTTFARILIDNLKGKLNDLPRWHGYRNAHKIWFKPGPYGYKRVKEDFLKIKFADVVEFASKAQDHLIEGNAQLSYFILALDLYPVCKIPDPNGVRAL